MKFIKNIKILKDIVIGKFKFLKQKLSFEKASPRVYSDKINTKDRLYMIVFATIFVFSAVGIPFFLWIRSHTQRTSSNEVVFTPSPTVFASIIPSPTTAKEMSQYSLQILNGSGVRKEATKVKEMLKGLTFKRVEVGNADSFDYVKTKVSFKKTLPEAVYREIEDILGVSYQMVKSDEYLANNSDFDLIIIIGKRKAKE